MSFDAWKVEGEQTMRRQADEIVVVGRAEREGVDGDVLGEVEVLASGNLVLGTPCLQREGHQLRRRERRPREELTAWYLIKG